MGNKLRKSCPALRPALPDLPISARLGPGPEPQRAHPGWALPEPACSPGRDLLNQPTLLSCSLRCHPWRDHPRCPITVLSACATSRPPVLCLLPVLPLRELQSLEPCPVHARGTGVAVGGCPAEAVALWATVSPWPGRGAGRRSPTSVQLRSHCSHRYNSPSLSPAGPARHPALQSPRWTAQRVRMSPSGCKCRDHRHRQL